MAVSFVQKIVTKPSAKTPVAMHSTDFLKTNKQTENKQIQPTIHPPMNANRRERIQKLISQIEGLVQEAAELRDEEQDAFDNMPESLQGSEKGEAASSACDALDTAVSELESAQGSLSDATDA